MPVVKNEKGEVKNRYIIKDIKNREWDSFYSLIHAYKFVSNLEDGTKRYGKKIIFAVALTEEWAKEQEDRMIGFKCLFCGDTGAKATGAFCSCDLGRAAYKYFGINAENYER